MVVYRVLLILVCGKASDRNTTLQLRESEAAQSYIHTLKPPNIYVQFHSKLMSGQAFLHEAGKEKVNLRLREPFLRKTASCFTSIRIHKGYQNGGICLKTYVGYFIQHEVRIP